MTGKALLGGRTLKDISIKQLKAALYHQRERNEKLISKLISDQKQFVSTATHYERKKAKLKCLTAMGRQQYLLDAQIQANQLLQQSTIDAHVVNQSVWREMALNSQMLDMIHSLNSNIDSYHLLIAKKNDEYNAIIQHETKTVTLEESGDDLEQKDLEEEGHGTAEKISNGISNENQEKRLGSPQKHVEHRENQDDMKEESPMNTPSRTPIYSVPLSSSKSSSMGTLQGTPASICHQVSPWEPAMSVSTMTYQSNPNDSVAIYPNQEDSMSAYAQQLIEQNTRYQEIVEILRKKVDEVRKIRKSEL